MWDWIDEKLGCRVTIDLELASSYWTVSFCISSFISKNKTKPKNKGNSISAALRLCHIKGEGLM